MTFLRRQLAIFRPLLHARRRLVNALAVTHLCGMPPPAIEILHTGEEIIRRFSALSSSSSVSFYRPYFDARYIQTVLSILLRFFVALSDCFALGIFFRSGLLSYQGPVELLDGRASTCRRLNYRAKLLWATEVDSRAMRAISE